MLQNERRFGERFNRLLERAGTTARYHPCHGLRHTFASDLLGAGVPMLKVSRWLESGQPEIAAGKALEQAP